MAGIKLDSNTTRNKAGKWPRIKRYKNKGRNKAGNSANNYLKQLCRGGCFFAAQQRIAITLSPNYYQKMQRFTTRKNQEEHGQDVK